MLIERDGNTVTLVASLEEDRIMLRQLAKRLADDLSQENDYLFIDNQELPITTLELWP